MLELIRLLLRLVDAIGTVVGADSEAEAKARALADIAIQREQLAELLALLSVIDIPTTEELRREWKAAEARGRARVTGEPPVTEELPP